MATRLARNRLVGPEGTGMAGVRNRIREARLARGIRSGAELARRVGYDQRSVSSWETGERLPTVKGALRLARVLGVSMEELFYLEDEEERPDEGDGTE